MRNYYPYNDPSYLTEQKDYRKKTCPSCPFSKTIKKPGQAHKTLCKFIEPKCPDILVAECKHTEFMR